MTHTAENDAGLRALADEWTRTADGLDRALVPPPAAETAVYRMCADELMRVLATRVTPPGAGRDPLECPPDGGCGGCGNWPEHCACRHITPGDLITMSSYGSGEPRILPPGKGDQS